MVGSKHKGPKRVFSITRLLYKPCTKGCRAQQFERNYFSTFFPGINLSSPMENRESWVMDRLCNLKFVSRLKSMSRSEGFRHTILVDESTRRMRKALFLLFVFVFSSETMGSSGPASSDETTQHVLFGCRNIYQESADIWKLQVELLKTQERLIDKLMDGFMMTMEDKNILENEWRKILKVGERLNSFTTSSPPLQLDQALKETREARRALASLVEQGEMLEKRHKEFLEANPLPSDAPVVEAEEDVAEAKPSLILPHIFTALEAFLNGIGVDMGKLVDRLLFCSIAMVLLYSILYCTEFHIYIQAAVFTGMVALLVVYSGMIPKAF